MIAGGPTHRWAAGLAGGVRALDLGTVLASVAAPTAGHRSWRDDDLYVLPSSVVDRAGRR